MSHPERPWESTITDSRASHCIATHKGTGPSVNSPAMSKHPNDRKARGRLTAQPCKKLQNVTTAKIQDNTPLQNSKLEIENH